MPSRSTVSMPVEPTKNKLKRRTSRCEDHRFDPSHGRELELKRNRGLSNEHSSFFFFPSFHFWSRASALPFISIGEVRILHRFFSSYIYWDLFRLVVPSAEGITHEYYQRFDLLTHFWKGSRLNATSKFLVNLARYVLDVSIYWRPTLSVCNSEEVVQLCVQMVRELPNALLVLLILLVTQVVWQLGKAPGTRSYFFHICFRVFISGILGLF